jgi:hypothetical protein
VGQPVKLEAITIAGMEGSKILLEGNYTGMQGAAPQPDYAVLAAIVMDSQKYISVKMAGPSALVKQQEQNFDDFCKSLEIYHFNKRIVGEHRKQSVDPGAGTTEGSGEAEAEAKENQP